MNLESNWRQKTIERLEKKIWEPLNQDECSSLVTTCNALRKKQLCNFSTGDLRIMIGQEIGLKYLIPLAFERLSEDLFAEGNYFEGDLLKNVLEINPEFWSDHETYRQQLEGLIEDRRDELAERGFDHKTIDRFWSIKNLNH